MLSPSQISPRSSLSPKSMFSPSLPFSLCPSLLLSFLHYVLPSLPASLPFCLPLSFSLCPPPKKKKKERKGKKQINKQNKTITQSTWKPEAGMGMDSQLLT